MVVDVMMKYGLLGAHEHKHTNQSPYPPSTLSPFDTINPKHYSGSDSIYIPSMHDEYDKNKFH